jgi:hypothetical protein
MGCKNTSPKRDPNIGGDGGQENGPKRRNEREERMLRKQFFRNRQVNTSRLQDVKLTRLQVFAGTFRAKFDVAQAYHVDMGMLCSVACQLSDSEAMWNLYAKTFECISRGDLSRFTVVSIIFAPTHQL